MLSDARHTQIVKYLEAHHSASVQDLARDLYASPSTIRRDLSELEALGFLRRVHGGAVLTTGSTFDTPASLRRTQQLAEKQRIADLASRFLSSSSTYFFDSSSTAAIFALKLRDYPDVSIATNGLGLLSNLQSSSNLSIFSCGGFLRSPYDEFTGNMTLENISRMHADIFFFSCAGFPPSRAPRSSATKTWLSSGPFTATPASASCCATAPSSIKTFSSPPLASKRSTTSSPTAPPRVPFTGSFWASG